MLLCYVNACNCNKKNVRKANPDSLAESEKLKKQLPLAQTLVSRIIFMYFYLITYTGFIYTYTEYTECQLL